MLLPNQNGEAAGSPSATPSLRDDKAEIVEKVVKPTGTAWRLKNALGEIIVIDSSLMQYIACSPDYSMSGTMNDEGEEWASTSTTERAPPLCPQRRRR